MHFYRITSFEGDSMPEWEPTLAEAHARLKLKVGRDARIELIDVDTSKNGVLALLRGDMYSPMCATKGPLRTWALTPRGGLKEVANGE